MSESLLLGLLGITFIVITILGAIIVKQKQTIADFKHPQYGFLGKKLSMYFLSVCAFGVFTIMLYPKQSSIQTSISVSETTPTVEIEIVYNLISQQEQTYQFTLVPKINAVDWGDENSIFEIQWSVNSKIQTEFVSKDEPGGILIRLDSGKNIISGSITYLGFTYKKEIELDI